VAKNINEVFLSEREPVANKTFATPVKGGQLSAAARKNNSEKKKKKKKKKG